MITIWVQLLLMLLIILVSAQLFTNALEYAGQKLKISEGVTGSLFAAIATALPETTVPIIAIIAGTQNQAINEQISVGAILGAPLMLSTLSTFLMTLMALKLRGIKGRIKPEKTGFTRDLNFFLMAFFLAALAMYVPPGVFYIRAIISILLVSLYVGYVTLTVRASQHLVNNGHGVVPEQPLFFTKIKFKNNTFSIFIQLIFALGLLLFGAKGFITGVEEASNALHISALLLSLLIIPIATELPEKVNSILWIKKRKDTLGVGNITGAMVFQGTLLPALGIWLTPWQPSKEVLTGIVITLIASFWLRVNILHKGLPIAALLFNGGLYVVYLWLTLR